MATSRMEKGNTVDRQVTLQVNVAPGDLPHAGHTLAHHLRRWESQVAGVIYTLDLRQSAGPRGAHFNEYRPGMMELLGTLVGAAPERRRLLEVDYGAAAAHQVADAFFGAARVPSKDCFGAPFYPYFFGLLSVPTRYVLHMDCDMLFGGGARTWLNEAVAMLESRPETLFISPLAGPPGRTPRIPREVRRSQRRTQRFGSLPVLEDEAHRTYRLRHVSSRIFVADLERLRAVSPVPILEAPPWTFGSDLATTPYLPAEISLSGLMRQRGLVRLDRLGTGPGMWFVHPGQRGPEFTSNLPNLIAALERNDFPVEQSGRFELSDEWLDAVGPSRYRRPRPSAAQRARSCVGTATGARRLRKLIWQAQWALRDRPVPPGP
jgi:hypothetical protein